VPGGGPDVRLPTHSTSGGQRRPRTERIVAGERPVSSAISASVMRPPLALLAEMSVCERELCSHVLRGRVEQRLAVLIGHGPRLAQTASGGSVWGGDAETRSTSPPPPQACERAIARAVGSGTSAWPRSTLAALLAALMDPNDTFESTRI
jgi:hypothetical protein